MKRAAYPLLFLVAGCSTPKLALPPSPVAERVPNRAAEVDSVLVDKSDRTLTLFSRGVPLKSYAGLQLGDAPDGPKHFEGDERTPEGRYTVDYRNPRSAYHLSLHISYPNAADRAYAAARGRSPGGEIFIHGQPNALAQGRMQGDWTDGCISVSNAEIEELWRAVPDGTAIEIRP
uniref:L,D-transpeptidase family protein n=1 Tax=Altererythrobacter segetis TaxID=1104773 RepID=UPI001407ED44|nr:L,D-transpeptidase family protein [Altererythrobacter segetis]